jgi:RNA polymerase sigma factor (sigma-70 family)
MEDADRPSHAGADADDLAAISEVLRGNPDAFRAIVDRYSGLVLRLAVASLGSREDAEEAAQEIFLRAYRSLRSFRLGSRFLPWLYSIASNHLKTSAVRVRRSRDRLVRGAEETLAAPAAGDPQASTVRAQSLQEIRAAVTALPAPVREVVRLYYFEGMSVEQVGEALAIGRENVKSRLLRGRRKLWAVLGERDATAGPDSEYTRSEDRDEGEREAGA